MELNIRIMPPIIQELHKLQFACSYDEGIEFEPYKNFLSWKETQDWFRAWTGNANADASAYLIFGQDGTGGYAAFWLIRDSKELLNQPIVFFGSEGEVGVIAQNFSDYLWLLAGGLGPYEAVAQLDEQQKPSAIFTKFAKQHAMTPQSNPTEIVARAATEFTDFEEQIMSLCQ